MNRGKGKERLKRFVSLRG